MPFIDSTITLIAFIAVVLALIFRKTNVAISLAVGSMLSGFLAFGPTPPRILLEHSARP